MPLELKLKKITESARIPQYAHAQDSGLDLAADENITLRPGAWTSIRTGIALELPSGTEGQIRPRSGLAANHGVTVLNAPGTIDAGYRGEIMVILINMGRRDYRIKRGDRIAQLVICPVAKVKIKAVSKLRQTKRGDRGLGSSG